MIFGRSARCRKALIKSALRLITCHINLVCFFRCNEDISSAMTKTFGVEILIEISAVLLFYSIMGNYFRIYNEKRRWRHRKRRGRHRKRRRRLAKTPRETRGNTARAMHLPRTFLSIYLCRPISYVERARLAQQMSKFIPHHPASFRIASC